LFDGLGRCFWEAANMGTHSKTFNSPSPLLSLSIYISHPALSKQRKSLGENKAKLYKKRKRKKKRIKTILYSSCFRPLEPQTFEPWRTLVRSTGISGTRSSKTKS